MVGNTQITAANSQFCVCIRVIANDHRTAIEEVHGIQFAENGQRTGSADMTICRILAADIEALDAFITERNIRIGGNRHRCIGTSADLNIHPAAGCTEGNRRIAVKDQISAVDIEGLGQILTAVDEVNRCAGHIHRRSFFQTCKGVDTEDFAVAEIVAEHLVRPFAVHIQRTDRGIRQVQVIAHNHKLVVVGSSKQCLILCFRERAVAGIIEDLVQTGEAIRHTRDSHSTIVFNGVKCHRGLEINLERLATVDRQCTNRQIGIRHGNGVGNVQDICSDCRTIHADRTFNIHRCAIAEGDVRTVRHHNITQLVCSTAGEITQSATDQRSSHSHLRVIQRGFVEHSC